jgi:hypothetical protein
MQPDPASNPMVLKMLVKKYCLPKWGDAPYCGIHSSHLMWTGTLTTLTAHLAENRPITPHQMLTEDRLWKCFCGCLRITQLSDVWTLCISNSASVQRRLVGEQNVSVDLLVSQKRATKLHVQCNQSIVEPGQFTRERSADQRPEGFSALASG